jgi:hypothetical protein
METLNNGPFIRYLETTRSIGSFPHTQKKIWGECLLFRALTILWDQIWTGKNCDNMEFSRALTDTAVWTGKMFGVKFDSFLNNMLQCSTSCTTHVIAGWLCKASSQFSQDSSWNHAWFALTHWIISVASPVFRLHYGRSLIFNLFVGDVSWSATGIISWLSDLKSWWLCFLDDRFCLAVHSSSFCRLLTTVLCLFHLIL